MPWAPPRSGMRACRYAGAAQMRGVQTPGVRPAYASRIHGPDGQLGYRSGGGGRPRHPWLLLRKPPPATGDHIWRSSTERGHRKRSSRSRQTRAASTGHPQQSATRPCHRHRMRGGSGGLGPWARPPGQISRTTAQPLRAASRVHRLGSGGRIRTFAKGSKGPRPARLDDPGIRVPADSTWAPAAPWRGHRPGPRPPRRRCRSDSPPIRSPSISDRETTASRAGV